MEQAKREIEKKLKINLDKKNNSKDILFFTGSGISAPDPCGFPLGQELHKMLLQYFTDMSSSEIMNFLQRHDVPVFEKTVSIIMNQYGQITNHNRPFNLLSDIFIYRIFENFKQKNDYHKYFRKHIQKGGKHFTVNLDQFIELDRGILPITTRDINMAERINDSSVFYKIHGDPIIDPIGFQGFLNEVIRNGFSENTQNFFDRHINQVKIVIFVGYGGVDKFDVTPYFANKPNGFFEQTTALWINYTRDQQIRISENLSYAQQVILSKFNNGLAIECSPEKILNMLFEDFPAINTVHCLNGYRREYENFFRQNILSEIFDNLNGLAENQINQQIRNYMCIRQNIRNQLIN